MNTAVKQIIDNIKEIAEKKGYWAITTGKVMEITRIEPYQFRNHLNRARRRVNIPEDVRVFNNENPGDLITLLECIYGKDENIENLFSETGIFINYNNMIELNELFINTVNTIQINHTINEDDFQAMIYGTESFLEARRIYLDEEFDMKKIIKDVCKKYITKKQFNLKELAEKNITGYLKSLFDRNILTKEALLYGVVNKLKEYAKKHGMVKEEKANSNRTNHRRTTDFDEKQREHKQNEKLNKTEQAKLILNIKGEFNSNTLKKQYREMMKIYHPDLNPSGLEKSQEINTAYSILLSEIS